jgi:chromosome segregation ATPase
LKTKNGIDECKKQVKANNFKYNNLHEQDKKKLDILKSIPKNLNKNEIKSLNNELKKNREEKNELKIIIEKNNEEIETLNKELHKLYDEKNEIEKSNKSVYYIITNLKTLNIEQVKKIYKKRWCVETHFMYGKKLSKLNSMNNKNYEYVKQNIAITQFIFLTLGYIQYILNKK